MKKLFFNVLVFVAAICLPLGLSAHTIVASAGENGIISPSGDVEVNDGDDQLFTITPNDGYRVASVIVDAANVTENIVAGDGVFLYTFENVTEDHSINVTFESIPTYTITVNAGENGYVYYNDALVSDNVTVSEGATPAFEITPATNYQIAVLTVDENAIDLTQVQLGGYTYTFDPVMANHTLAVTFEEIPATTYTITATVLGGHGTVDPDGEITVPAGSDYDVTFVPDEGYDLDSVVVNGIVRYPVEGPGYITNNVYQLTNISEDYTITVKYKDIRTYYHIHVDIETAGGTVSPADTSVVEGSDVTLVVTPNEGYHVSQFTIDGNTITNSQISEIAFENVQADHQIKISFMTNSINEESLSVMSIYPNPNNGMFSIDFSNIEGDATYQIINVRGAVVETRNINVMDGATMNFNHNLNAGTYFVRIISGDKVYVEQIVVE